MQGVIKLRIDHTILFLVLKAIVVTQEVVSCGFRRGFQSEEVGWKGLTNRSVENITLRCFAIPVILHPCSNCGPEVDVTISPDICLNDSSNHIILCLLSLNYSSSEKSQLRSQLSEA